MRLRYQGGEILNLSAEELSQGENTMEILIDKTIAEIFINHGKRYIINNLKGVMNKEGLIFDSHGLIINHLGVYEMKSIWNNATGYTNKK